MANIKDGFYTIDGVEKSIDPNIKYDIDKDVTYVICKECSNKVEAASSSTHEYGFTFECSCGEIYNI